MKLRLRIGALVLLVQLSCAKDSPFLSGHIRRAHDAVMTTCDPYNRGDIHSCVIFSAAFKESLYIYDATAGEMVLSPIKYFPLKVKVGRATDKLVRVVSDNKQFPLMLAVDKEASIYAVRLFPSSDNKVNSFATPKKYDLDKTPYQMAAADIDNKIVAILTYPEDGRIKLMLLDPQTGSPDIVAQKSITLGSKPSHVVIDAKRSKAVISDEGSTALRVMDLANIIDVLTKGAALVVDSIPIATQSEQIYLSHRDLGDGEYLYALVFASAGKDIKLVNINNKNLTSFTLAEEPMAAYFPDSKSEKCCKDNKQWLSVASIKGKLSYLSLSATAGALKLEKISTMDLTSESNLALSKLHIKKIIGGSIEVDSKIDRERLCSSNRMTFYVASYANKRSHLDTEPYEVEAHGYSCEGEDSASRFGFKNK